MKKNFLLTITTILFCVTVNAQSVGINTDGSAPDNSAMLDVKNPTKGFLAPRVALTATNVAAPVTSPALSLLVFNTATAGTSPNNVTPGYYYWNGNTWTQFTGATGSAGPVGIGYGGTSNSPKTIGLGSKTFSTQAGLAYINGERIRFVDQTNSANFLEGTITSYSGTNMVVNIDNSGGTGTISNWNMSVGGNLGTPGADGLNGANAVVAFADFYALMPGDNAATVPRGGSVQFPQDGPLNGISRSSASTFVLPTTGTYEINFQVSVQEPGQLVVVLNGTELPYTVVGRAQGSSQIVGTCLIPATAGDLISINNSFGSNTALTITPVAGGTQPVSAHLIIKKLN